MGEEEDCRISPRTVDAEIKDKARAAARTVERVRPQDLPALVEYTVDPGAPPEDALYYSISPADVYPEWGPREDVPWYNWGVWAKFGRGEYGGSMVTGVHLPHGYIRPRLRAVFQMGHAQGLHPHAD